MAVRYKANGERARRFVKKTMVESLNIGARAHVTFSQLIVAQDTHRLQESIRLEQEATEENPQAIVKAGGIEVRGKLVSYAEYIEMGHRTVNGGYVAAQPFFLPGVDLARDRILQAGQKGFGSVSGPHGPVYETR